MTIDSAPSVGRRDFLKLTQTQFLFAVEKVLASERRTPNLRGKISHVGTIFHTVFPARVEAI